MTSARTRVAAVQPGVGRRAQVGRAVGARQPIGRVQDRARPVAVGALLGRDVGDAAGRQRGGRDDRGRQPGRQRDGEQEHDRGARSWGAGAVPWIAAWQRQVRHVAYLNVPSGRDRRALRCRFGRGRCRGRRVGRRRAWASRSASASASASASGSGPGRGARADAAAAHLAARFGGLVRRLRERAGRREEARGEGPDARDVRDLDRAAHVVRAADERMGR